MSRRCSPTDRSRGPRSPSSSRRAEPGCLRPPWCTCCSWPPSTVSPSVARCRGCSSASSPPTSGSGEQPPTELKGERRETALAELARRYLTGHGPATDVDLAYWAGLPLRDARFGLRAIGAELDELGDGLVALRAARRRAPATGATEAPALVRPLPGRLEGIRTRCAARTHRRRRQGRNDRGHRHGRGQAVGTWSAHRRGRSANVDIRWWHEVAEAEREALIAEAEDVDRFERS